MTSEEDVLKNYKNFYVGFSVHFLPQFSLKEENTKGFQDSNIFNSRVDTLQ